MRIVIDLQGAQTASRFRGIGRYTLALTHALLRNAGEHDIWLVLNAALAPSIADLRAAFDGLLPPHRIRSYDIPSPVAEMDSRAAPRCRAAELLREHFLARLQPDMVLLTSLFEGYVEDAVSSVGLLGDGARTAVILYDLIPLLNPQAYLGAPTQRQAYARKIDSLRRAGLLLAISDHARREAIDALGLAPERVVAISTAVDDSFTPGAPDARLLAALRARFALTQDLVLCAPGGIEPRKNIPALITAFGMLPAPLRAACQLVVASRIQDADRAALTRHARACGLAPEQLVLTGYLSDAELVCLYRSATLFVFPSLHEGFGLPALEAMACGAPVIGSDNTSIPEVIGLADAMFDAGSPAAIAQRMEQALSRPAWRERLRAHGQVQAGKFSWDRTARLALRALEQHAAGQAPVPAADGDGPLLAALSRIDGVGDDDALLVRLAQCMAAWPLEGQQRLLFDVSGAPDGGAALLAQLVGRTAAVQAVTLSAHGGPWHYRSLDGAVADVRDGDLLLCAGQAPREQAAACADGLYANLNALGVRWYVMLAFPAPPAWLACVARYASGVLGETGALESQWHDWQRANAPDTRAVPVTDLASLR